VKPEIYKLKHTLRLGVSVRIKFKSKRISLLLGVAQGLRITYGSQLKFTLKKETLERGKQIKQESRRVNTMIYFTEVWFQKTYSPLRRSQRSGLFQPFPSLKRSLRSSEPFP
jgi:hypothetical protein